MEKVANVKSRDGVTWGYIVYSNGTYFYIRKGMFPKYIGDNFNDIEDFILKDESLSFWGARPVYLKGFICKYRVMLNQ